jgi:dihydroflavonol-4-reductase
VRAAVTGATGFVGQRLVRRLHEMGAETTLLVRSEVRARPFSGPARLVLGDLESRPALSALASGADTLFHVAGLVAARSEAEFLRVNRDGARRVAEAARAAGVRRMVLVSSLAATGPALPGEPVTEETPPAPVTPYGRSKLAGEEAARSVGVPLTVVRPPAVYGAGDRAFLSLFRCVRLGVAPVLGDGQQELSLVHVDDLVDALLAVGGAAACEGRLYHAAGPEVVTQRGLVQAIGRALGRHGVSVLPLSPPLVRVVLRLSAAAASFAGRATMLAPDKEPEFLAPAWTCSSAAVARDAGWRASIPLERGLTETATWYRDRRWLA